MLKLFIGLKTALRRLAQQEAGQGLTEYALILALIVIIAIVALQLLGGGITSVLSTAANSLNANV